MTTKPKVSIAELSSQDLNKAISTILLAFAADPGARWFSSTADSYIRNMSSYARIMARTSISNSSAICTDNLSGVAIWLPPGVTADEEAIAAALEPSENANTKDMEELSKQSKSYCPDTPYWYLSMIGVDPKYQRQGLGKELMTHSCEILDSQGAPAYLESSNPENVSLYMRHGFEVLGSVQVGASPTITLMFRDSR